MNRKLVLTMFIMVTQLFILSTGFSNENGSTTLRVALYPYVPKRLALFQKIEAIFESRNPGINLELVEDTALLWDYYTGGLQATDADVYEVDTILLSDLIQAGKISPIELPTASYTEETITAVTRAGNVYGVPHWLCGNFLFYRKGDHEIKTASTWNELHSVFAKRGDALFVDFKGKSTLGEWYLTVLSGLYGSKIAQSLILKKTGNTLDRAVVGKLELMLSTCPAGYCRNDDLHDRTGYYARAFIAGRSGGYIGYSESMHFGIQYAIDNCTQTTGCLSIDDIAVRRLPGFAGSTRQEGIGWVDALALDADLDSEKKASAIRFIRFMVSDEAYQAILEPDWGEAPRYLIPAKTGVQIKNAPLYNMFYKAHSGRKTGTAVGLNDKLREVGKTLDCALPISRTDTKSLDRCSSQISD